MRAGTAFRSTLVVAVLACLAAASPAGASDRTTAWHVDPSHDGIVHGGSLRPPLHRIWSRHLGGGGYTVIVGGRVFAFGAAQDHTVLYALSARTGKTLWRTDLPGWTLTGPAYDRGRVFTATELGEIQAFDARTGMEVWRAGLTGNPWISTPPTAKNGVLYLSDADDGAAFLAFNESNGTLRWARTVYGGTDSSAAVDRRRVFVSYVGPQVYAFDALGGKLAWHFSGCCEGGGGWTPSVYRGRVYTRDTTYGNHVLDERTGRPRGRFAALQPPAFWGSTALFHVQSGIVARRVGSLQKRWIFRGDGHLSTAPIVVHGVAYVGSSSGQGLPEHLYGVSVRTGRRVWSRRVKDHVGGDDERAGVVAGLSSGDGILTAPVGNRLVAFKGRRAIRPH